MGGPAGVEERKMDSRAERRDRHDDIVGKHLALRAAEEYDNEVMNDKPAEGGSSRDDVLDDRRKHENKKPSRFAMSSHIRATRPKQRAKRPFPPNVDPDSEKDENKLTE